MIFFELIGGLGNQLFEYAFARSLAHDFDEKLYLDISRYNFRMNIVHNIYGLHAYNIRAIVCGVESNGMILCASVKKDGVSEQLTLLTPEDKDIPLGSRVS